MCEKKNGELDVYKDQVNNSAKHADHNKILPHSVPNNICLNPSEYGVLDFKDDTVDNELIPELQELEGGIENMTSGGSYYMGGVNNGQGIDETHSVELDAIINVGDPLPLEDNNLPEIEVSFTSDEDDDSNRDGTW
ncbi:hypothetical protein BDQ17DRAFT_1323867 [Cyathus striatus]|nr:hypothetical protein BDQ17DRAFT_1323867 [Cyathus striatus]